MKTFIAVLAMLLPAVAWAHPILSAGLIIFCACSLSVYGPRAMAVPKAGSWWRHFWSACWLVA